MSESMPDLIALAQRRLLIAWLRDGIIGVTDLRIAEPGKRHVTDLYGAEAWEAALAIEGPERRKVESWIIWARKIIDGVPQRRPHKNMLPLLQSMESDTAGAVARRCAALLGEKGNPQNTEEMA